MAAVGLSLADLFDRPARDAHQISRRPPLPPARELLALLEYDLAAIDIAVGALARGEPMTPDDRDTLRAAIADVRRVLEQCHAIA